MQEELLTLSRKELDRLVVMKHLVLRELSQQMASDQLGISVRQIRRVLRRYRGEGAAGLRSRKRGRTSNRCLPEVFRDQVMHLVVDKYADFGPTLACEKLIERDGIRLSVSTLRSWMIEAHIHRERKRRKGRVHPLRPRRPCVGELVQIDGSPHPWFEGRGPNCVLINFIDDATSRILFMRMYPAETTAAYMDALRTYLRHYGRPVTLYPDRHSIFRVNREEVLHASGLTQFGRILKNLDIELVCAYSPQAKGRVERSFETLQDRLVKELRLEGIDTIEAANTFLEKYRHVHNQRFAVMPRSDHDSHRQAQHSEEELDRIFSFQYTRTLSKCLSIQYKNTTYQILTKGPGLALRGAKVTVCQHTDNRITILFKNRLLPYRTIEKSTHYTPIKDTKTINLKVDNTIKNKRKKSHWKPPPDHPWRNYKSKPSAYPNYQKRTSLSNLKEDISI